MTVAGVVREFDAGSGWGVIDSEATPGGCFVHFSVIDRPGFRTLTSGQDVNFEFDAVSQDGFRFRATWVSLPPARSDRPARAVGRAGSTQGSTLTIVDHDGTAHLS